MKQMIAGLFNPFIRTFFNLWYRIKPPSMVQYWKTSEKQPARVTVAKDGSYQMDVQGEKYPMGAHPRGHLLQGLQEGEYPIVSRLKYLIKTEFFNKLWAEIDRLMAEAKYDELPPERMPAAVRELWRAFEELEHAEVTPDMKGRIRLIKRVICFIFTEDDAYRHRFQWLMERLDVKKLYLTKADLYYLRGKYFKPDKKKRFLGIDFDGYGY